jgi:hypothetical protein
MRRLSEQAAEILAGLHNKKLWHSNLKASDFIVSGNGPEDYRIVLTDMEGIKQYFLRKEARRMQMLSHLAASAMAIPAVRRTDYLRMFKVYCQKADIPDTPFRKDVYRMLTQEALAEFQSIGRRQKT